MDQLPLFGEHHLQKLRVIERTLSDLSVAEAAMMLDLSRRQVFRLKAAVRASGPFGIIHGNTGRPSAIAKPPALHDHVIELYRNEFFDYNATHFTEALNEECGITIGYSTVLRWLRGADISLRQHRANVCHRCRRERRARFGEWLFLDGSPHHWLGLTRPKVTLILATDDATGRPLYGGFFPQETLAGCFEVLYYVFRHHGLPGTLYLDKAGQFTTTRRGGTYRFQRDDQPTHFELAMRALAVHIIFADSPQARGRGERINGTFQGRLVAELRRKGIADPGPATVYLNDTFIPDIARRFGVKPRDPRPAFRKPPEHVDLRTVLCARATREVSNDNTISYGAQEYQLLPTRRSTCIAGSQVQVQEWFDGSVHVFHHRTGELGTRKLPVALQRPRRRSTRPGDIFTGVPL